jgi:hypothetical protein
MPVALEKGHDNPYVRACFRRTLPLRYTSKRQFVQSFTSDLRHSTALAFQSTQDRAKSVIPLEKNMVEIPKSKVCGPVSSGAKRKKCVGRVAQSAVCDAGSQAGKTRRPFFL